MFSAVIRWFPEGPGTLVNISATLGSFVASSSSTGMLEAFETAFPLVVRALARLTATRLALGLARGVDAVPASAGFEAVAGSPSRLV